MADNKKTGDYGERLAAEYLSGKGYIIIEKKFRCRTGEIDIIASDDDYYVFVEVKLRRNLSKGYPREAVGYAKQVKIRKTALGYLSLHGVAEADMRFDVIEIIGADTVTIEHIENAF